MRTAGAGCSLGGDDLRRGRAPGASLPRELQGAVAIGVVSGEEETNPLWTSEVGNDAFRAALEQNLVRAGARARDEPSAAYRLDATIVGLDQPMMGLDAKVTSTVPYTMTPLAGGEPLSTLVIESFTATFADAALGVERLRLANEGSIRRNIETFMDRLVEHYGR